MAGYPCCCSPSLVCEACNNDKAPIYWEVTISGLFEASDCVSCDHYNDVVFTLSHFGGETDWCDPAIFAFEDYCCWFCFINSSFYGCAGGFSPNSITLSIFDNRIRVSLSLSGNVPVKWEKDYETAIDCVGLEDDLDWLSNGFGNCSGDGSSSVHIKAVSAISNPCCREIFYADCSPDEITVVVAGLQNDTCSDCASLNGTYILQRQDEQGSQNQCYVAFFEETCGMDALTIKLVANGTVEVIFHNYSTYLSGNSLSFVSANTAVTPLAECDQWDNTECRASGDIGVCIAGNGDPYDAMDPNTYATATVSW